MKKLCFALMLMLMLAAVACGAAERMVHCDRCDKEFAVKGDSPITEDWIVFCDDCDDFDVVS